jgi:diguanylate cyclase (GGDEF)-like protein
MEQALERVATAIKKGLRGGDLLFRYGGDEFLVLLTQTDAETAKLVANRIAHKIKEEHSDVKDSDRVDVALGVASAPSDGLTIESLVVSAEKREQSTLDPPPQTSIH